MSGNTPSKKGQRAEAQDSGQGTERLINGVPENPDQDPGDGGYPGQGTPGVGGNPTNEEMRARAANPDELSDD